MYSFNHWSTDFKCCPGLGRPSSVHVSGLTFLVMSHEKSLFFGIFTCDYDSWKPVWLGITFLVNVLLLSEFSLHVFVFKILNAAKGAA